MKRFGWLLLACGMFSCVDARYNLSKISTKMTFGGDSLSIPIGSTDSIRLSNVIDMESMDILSTDTNGYNLSVRDSIEVDIPLLDKEALRMDDQSYHIGAIQFDFGANIGDVLISGIEKTTSVEIDAGNVLVEDCELPSIDKTEIFGSGIKDYALDKNTLAVHVDPISLNKERLLKDASLPEEIQALLSYSSQLPEEIQNQTIPLILPQNDLEVSNTNTIRFSVNVPNDVSSIDWVALQKNPQAKLSISMSLLNADQFFESGSIVPDVQINPSDLFVFAERFNPSLMSHTGAILFSSDMSMNKENGYTVSRELHIDTLALGLNNPQNGKIDLEKNISVDGRVRVSDLKYKVRNFDRIKELGFRITVQINDMVVESMEFDIPSLRTDIQHTTDVEVENEFPVEVKKIESIKVKTIERDGVASYLSIQVKPSGIPEMQASIALKNLQIAFPKTFVLKAQEGLNPTTNVFTVAERILGNEGFTFRFELEGFDLSDQEIVNRKMTWKDRVSVSGEVEVGGRINSKNIPTSDAGIEVTLNSFIETSSVDLVTNDIRNEVPETMITLAYDVDITKKIKRLNVIEVEEGAYLSFTLVKPDLPKELVMDADLRIQFPSLFVFAPHPNLDENNLYHIKGDIPSEIRLMLQKLNIHKDLADGVLNLEDSVSVSGSITLLSGAVNSKILDDISGKTMSVTAKTDDIKIKSTSLQLNDLSDVFSDTTHINVAIEDIPQEILALDSLILADGACLEIAIKMENMPKLSESLSLHSEMQFSDLFIFDSDEVENGVWAFDDTIQGGLMQKKLLLRGLNLKGREIKGSLDLDEEIRYMVELFMKDGGEVINEGPIDVDCEVSLKNVAFDALYGLVDVQIDEVNEDVTLGNIPEMLKDTANKLDLAPVICITSHTNLGMPFTIEGILAPMSDRGVLKERSEQWQFSINRAPSSSQAVKQHFWMANTTAGMPDDHQFVELDTKALFSTIPDGFSIQMKPSMDKRIRHEYQVNDDYFMNIDYEVIVPLVFGEKLRLGFKDTVGLSGIDDIVEMFSGGELEILADVINTLPLQLDVTLTPTDAYGNVLDAIQPVHALIKGSPDGEPFASNVMFKLQDKNDQLSELGAFIMEFTASSSNASASIKPDDFVKVALKARIIGGITIDE